MFKDITIKLFQIVNVKFSLLLMILYGLTICSMPENVFAESLALSALGLTPAITSIKQSNASDGTLIFSIKGSGFEAEGCTSIIVAPPSSSQSTSSDGKVIFYIKSGRFEAEGCTSVVVQPTPAPVPTSVQIPTQEPNLPSTNAPIPAPESKLIPTVESISPLNITTDGKITITIKGSGLDNEAIVEVYDSTGKYIGSGILSGTSSRRTSDLSKTMKGVKAGKYTVRIKNTNGQYSNKQTLIIREAQKNTSSIASKSKQCIGSLSKKPKALYLGGGEATKIFERYLSQNSGVESELPRDIKIKFYEKEKETTDLSVQTIMLGDMEQMFVESQEDFLNKIKKQLKGRVAEFVPTLVDDAAKGNADYFQCP